MMNNYPNLIKPLKVNSLCLKNRIIAAPISGGFISKYKMEHLASISKGGAALVVLGCIHVDNDSSMIAPNWPGLFDPHMELYMEQLNVIHQYGAKASAELFHAGLWAVTENPLGPVDTLRDFGKDADDVKIHGMTEEGMERVANSYAETAITAKAMGFDMCMLHFAHGWLPAQFLSPLYNKRTDKYGGSFENRVRFPMMIVKRVREAVGPDYPLDMRISGDEHIEGGIELGDVIKFLQLVQDKIDMVNVSSGIDKYFEQTTYIESPQLFPHQTNVHLAAEVKKAVDIPVTTVGGITMPDEAEQIIADGRADGVYLARALLADPGFPNKARAGRTKDIVPCLRCVQCYHVATLGITQGCSVNPRFGRDQLLRLEAVEKRVAKKVVVVGGGPAGMKAALTAAEFGHHVILFEKTKELGGLINVAEYEDRKIDLRNYRRYLVNQVVSNRNITLYLNTEATPDMVKALNPDEVIVAVGSEPVVPPIKGIDRPNILTAIDAYKRLDQLGRKVVVIGGGEIGCEMGLSIAETGREAVIVEMTDRLAPAGNLLYKTALHMMMKGQKNLSWVMETVCREITDKGIKVTDRDGKERFIEADTILIAAGMRPKRKPAQSFYGIVYDVKLIGDCVRPGKVENATYDAFFAATSI
jgi:2,4-dienoyl-CoA reductase-like NADH-dependent reductase (Old Yellow Enzyme family)/thioredoxin reductase